MRPDLQQLDGLIDLLVEAVLQDMETGKSEGAEPGQLATPSGGAHGNPTTK